MDRFLLYFSAILWIAFSAQAQTADIDAFAEAETQIQTQEPVLDNYVEYGHITGSQEIPRKKILPQEDDLYDGSEIKPLFGTLSAVEKIETENDGFETNTSKDALQELWCTDKHLTQQVGAFLHKHLQSQNAKTVPERRSQLLFAKNLNPFEEIKEEELKKSFEASAAAIQLRMNENREIYRMCVSKNNKSKQFRDIYVLIYPFLTYYKIVVSNLMHHQEEIEDATFIYNW